MMNVLLSSKKYFKGIYDFFPQVIHLFIQQQWKKIIYPYTVKILYTLNTC